MLPSPVTVSSSDAEGPGAELRGLLAEHARISAWLDRLDALGTETPSAVSAQVRTDYLSRLAGVTAALGDCADGLREIVNAATKRIAFARDQLPELRIRHAVGELDDAALAQRLAVLRREATEAEQERGAVADLVQQADRAVKSAIARMPGGELPADAVAPAAQPALDDAFGEWQGPTAPESHARPLTSDPSDDAAGEGDELDFLESLPQTRPPAVQRSRAASGPPAAKLVCKSCRFANEATSWYCEKCGSELG